MDPEEFPTLPELTSLPPYEPPTVGFGPTDSFLPVLPPRYREIAVLGRGGIGVVLKVFDRELKREVALKVASHRKASARARMRFLLEAQTTAQLAHPGIVPLYDVGELPGGDFYVTMKVLEGGTLRQLMRERPVPRTPASTNRLLDHLIAVCQAVAYAHSRGVVHRDLKPENVMIGSHGETIVMDWGLARILGQPEEPGTDTDGVDRDARDLTQDGAVMGTVRYMSPEQASGAVLEIDATTDVWALGVILYEIVAGRPPFPSDSGSPHEVIGAILMAEGPPDPRSVDRNVPPELAAIARKCLAVEKGERYREAGELARELQLYREGRSVRALADPWYRRASKFARRNPWPTGSVAIAAVFVLAGLGVSRWREQARQLAEARADAEKATTEAGQAREDTPKARGLALQRHLQAVAAYDRARDLDPDDREIQAGRLVAGRRLGDFALRSGDFTLARHTYGALSRFGLSLREQQALLDGVTAAEEAELQRARDRVVEILRDLGEGLGRPDREARQTIEDYVFEAIRFPRPPVVEALRGTLRELGDASQEEREVATFACRVLAHHQDDESVVALAAFIERIGDPVVLVEAATALCRSGLPRAWVAMHGLSLRFEFTSYVWVHVQPLFRLLPVPTPDLPALVRGFAHHEREEYDLAVRALGEVIASTPPGEGHAALHMWRALSREKLGDVAGARQDFDRGLELAPDSVSILGNRAKHRSFRGDLAGAIEDYDRALEIEPTHALILAGRGWAHRRLGDLDRALADFDRALQIDPGIPDAYHGRGGVRLERGQREAAIADYDRLVEIAPTFLDGWTHRGRAKAELGRPDAAIIDFTRAIEIAPRAAMPYFLRAVTHARVGRLDAALPDFQRAAELEPGNMAYWRPCARCLLDLGRRDDARILLLGAIPEEPPERIEALLDRIATE